MWGGEGLAPSELLCWAREFGRQETASREKRPADFTHAVCVHKAFTEKMGEPEEAARLGLICGTDEGM